MDVILVSVIAFLAVGCITLSFIQRYLNKRIAVEKEYYPMAEKTLTDRQKMVLDFIVYFLRKNFFQPSIREIGDHMEIKSTNGVNDHLVALDRKGFIILPENCIKARALKFTTKTRLLYNLSFTEPRPQESQKER